MRSCHRVLSWALIMGLLVGFSPKLIAAEPGLIVTATDTDQNGALEVHVLYGNAKAKSSLLDLWIQDDPVGDRMLISTSFEATLDDPLIEGEASFVVEGEVEAMEISVDHLGGYVTHTLRSDLVGKQRMIHVDLGSFAFVSYEFDVSERDTYGEFLFNHAVRDGSRLSIDVVKGGGTGNANVILGDIVGSEVLVRGSTIKGHLSVWLVAAGDVDGGSRVELDSQAGSGSTAGGLLVLGDVGTSSPSEARMRVVGGEKPDYMLVHHEGRIGLGSRLVAVGVLGGGDDYASAYMDSFNSPDTSVEGGAVQLRVHGGSGRDELSVSCGDYPVATLEVDLKGGTGKDELFAYLSPILASGLAEHEVRVRLSGGSHRDNLLFQSLAGPAPLCTYDVDLDGGSGSDTIKVDATDVSGGATFVHGRIRLDGGCGGKDEVRLETDLPVLVRGAEVVTEKAK